MTRNVQRDVGLDMAFELTVDLMARVMVTATEVVPVRSFLYTSLLLLAMIVDSNGLYTMYTYVAIWEGCPRNYAQLHCESNFC
jgi:hypothetical protein